MTQEEFRKLYVRCREAENGWHIFWQAIEKHCKELEQKVIVSDLPAKFEPIFEETFEIFGLHFSKTDVNTLYAHLNVILINSKYNGCVYLDSHEREQISKALKLSHENI